MNYLSINKLLLCCCLVSFLALILPLNCVRKWISCRLVCGWESFVNNGSAWKAIRVFTHKMPWLFVTLLLIYCPERRYRSLWRSSLCARGFQKFLTNSTCADTRAYIWSKLQGFLFRLLNPKSKFPCSSRPPRRYGEKVRAEVSTWKTWAHYRMWSIPPSREWLFAFYANWKRNIERRAKQKTSFCVCLARVRRFYGDCIEKQTNKRARKYEETCCIRLLSSPFRGEVHIFVCQLRLYLFTFPHGFSISLSRSSMIQWSGSRELQDQLCFERSTDSSGFPFQPVCSRDQL